MRNLNAFADKEFDRLYEKHKQKIKHLNEQKRVKYDKLRLAASKPEDIAWILPETIDFKRSPNAPSLEKHLYIQDDGLFRADLGPWEREVLSEELSDKAVVAWLRNSVKRPWSLEIPYPIGGQFRPMFPDILIVRKDSNGLSFDILEPHDPSLADNYAKAIGLAQFAEKHWNIYDRIQLIRKKKGSDGKNHHYRLDLGKQAVRKKVLRITNNPQLDEIFESLSRTGTMDSSAG